ncbi:hypothetical protein IQE94_03045 [Synechocystis sp. PCC 7339]|uniref:hypothetical protein n=1 Tax=unclassified Synechocystis TaxID=2640012 RepID=UPI001BB0514E|nr:MULTISPECIES: hypothetical protein [unclassified Synechocystis]QUS59227.1 hypothetical protein HTZ78_10980 [Synechocystis sp. PCC 7338]UAJ73320.1 hypothetical protein IQE94_03045 [Synechocystis sp. PCC 7339]
MLSKIRFPEFDGDRQGYGGQTSLETTPWNSVYPLPSLLAKAKITTDLELVQH